MASSRGYDFPIKTCSKPNKKLSQCFFGFKKTIHDHCIICEELPGRFSCNDKFFVYKITCSKSCKFYIGETCRPFRTRLDEHRRSVNNRDGKSALSDHLQNDHSNDFLTFEDFRFNILSKFNTPVETRIGEARLISELGPQLNRRSEMRVS